MVQEIQYIDPRDDVTFKMMMRELVPLLGLKLEAADLPQNLTTDILVRIPPEIVPQLENSAFISGMKSWKSKIF
jgi:hypothetical protein